jgi:histidine ammonia-lyase
MALAIEIMTAAAGVDQRAPLRPSVGVRAAHACVRQVVPALTEDRPLYKDIEAIVKLIDTGALTSAVATATQALV